MLLNNIRAYESNILSRISEAILSFIQHSINTTYFACVISIKYRLDKMLSLIYFDLSRAGFNHASNCAMKMNENRKVLNIEVKVFVFALAMSQ